jgi:uncharacterized protein YceH (UPF0502 family)
MDESQRNNYEQRLQELKKQLADLRKRWPAHSVKPEMVNQLEDLEEEVAHLQKKLQTDNST